MIKLLIADDHPYISDGVEAALASYDVKIVGKTTSLDNLPELIDKSGAEVLLLDINFGSGNETGIDFAREYIPKNPDIGIVVFSQYEEINVIRGAYEAGAKAFTSKMAPSEELFTAIESAAKGVKYVPEVIRDILVEYSLDPTSNKVSDPRLILNEKEMEWFLLAASGLTQSEIAENMGCTQKTAASKVASLKSKLGYKTTNDFSIVAGQFGLLRPNLSS